MGGKASYDTVITIKKYSNRRLYDMAHSRYLTIEELGELIQQGFDVQVVDSKTKAVSYTHLTLPTNREV